MTFKPFGDRLFIKPDPKTDMIAGIQMLGSDIQEEPRGYVMAVGTGVALNNIKIDITFQVDKITDDNESKIDRMLERVERIMELQVKGRDIIYKVGDHVIYGRYAGTKVTIDGTEGLIMREQDVFGVVVDENTGENDY